MKNKKDNIAEYILYLWQLEDYLRAFPEQAEGNDELTDILRMMHADDVMDGGHISCRHDSYHSCAEHAQGAHRPSDHE